MGQACCTDAIAAEREAVKERITPVAKEFGDGGPGWKAKSDKVIEVEKSEKPGKANVRLDIFLDDSILDFPTDKKTSPNKEGEFHKEEAVPTKNIQLDTILPKADQQGPLVTPSPGKAEMTFSQVRLPLDLCTTPRRADVHASPRRMTCKIDSEVVLSTNFEPLEYRNKKAMEVLNIPSEIDAKLPGSMTALFEKYGAFHFCLTEFPGKDLPLQTIAFDADEEIIYHGQGYRPAAGEFVKEGKGMLSKQSFFYSGYFKEDKFFGPGLLVLAEGQDSASYLLAYWEGDVPVGKALIYNSAGYEYSGEVSKEGLQHGSGQELWPNGSFYKGEFKHGLKHGKGETNWPGQAKYVGEYVDGMFDGHGTFEWVQGNVYRGDWRSNMIHGKGKFIWADGMIYEGSYVKGKREGMGTLTWPDKTSWKGQWKDGKRITSEGRFLTSDEDILVKR